MEVLRKIRFISFLLIFSIFLQNQVYSLDRAVDESYVAPDFLLEDINGRKISLDAYRDKKAVLIIFWTTWCPYCLRALSVLKQEKQDLDNAQVEVLAINMEESAFRVRKFVERLGINFTVLLDRDGRVSEEYGIFGIPYYFLIAKNGKIVFRGSRFSKEKLRSLIY